MRYQRGRTRRPLVLGAHMDHPGFVVTAVRGRRIDLEFRGGLPATYGKRERLRLFAAQGGGELGVARVTSVRADERGRIASAKASVEAGGSVNAGNLALWDVPAFELRGDTVHARGCDDLAGCAQSSRRWNGQRSRVRRGRSSGCLHAPRKWGCEGPR